MTEQSLSPDAPATIANRGAPLNGRAALLALIPLALLAAVVVVIVRTNAGLGPSTPGGFLHS